MPEVLEFFIPARPTDLDDESKRRENQYFVEMTCDFEVPKQQQLDDLTRLFDSLYREKSPTALFTRPELFYPLYSYMKAVQSERSVDVIAAARHKMCHEIGERMKKLLQVSVAFLRKRSASSTDANPALEVCLRSTLKMYLFVLCCILSSTAPTSEDEEGGVSSSQPRSRRRRKRDTDAGFGGDGSGVDLDGRELALTCFVEACSPELLTLWPDDVFEETTLNQLFKTTLHMITQKANIHNDAQSISGMLAVLLSRVMTMILKRNSTLDASDLVAPLIELSLKSDNAALFLSRLVSDIEQDEASSEFADRLLGALFDGMASAALCEAAEDPQAAKNIALFFNEVAKKSVSVTVKMSEIVLSTLNSESYDIRKSVVTCLAEMISQRYTGIARNASEDATRNAYLNELLFRVMDTNPFVRNHTLHVWERLVEARAVPKRYHLALLETTVGRLEDRNYLVRDSALAAITNILTKNWFGGVLNDGLLSEKLREAREESNSAFESDEALLSQELEKFRHRFRPVEESSETVEQEEAVVEDNDTDATPPPAEVEAATPTETPLNDSQVACLNKVLFYENAIAFTALLKKSLQYASILLDSKTERDVVESIKLIVAGSEYRIEGAEKAFRKVLVMVFEGEPKIQLAVRDAFAEVIFVSIGRLAGSATTRLVASAQKIISVLSDATEGEASAVERIFGLFKLNPAYGRYLSSQFIETIWGIAEGSIDQEASMDDRRTAMRIYSLLCKTCWKDLRTRHDSILAYLNTAGGKDNVILSYVFNALQNESSDPQFRPIPADVDPSSHPILHHLVVHLCRPTTAVASWMCMARAAVNTIHHLCAVPAVLFNYVLECLGSRCATAAQDDHAQQDEGAACAKAQLFFVLGATALKQLVAIENTERMQLKALEDTGKAPAPRPVAGGDEMGKELGLGSHDFQRHTIQELAAKRKVAIVSDGSVWHRFAPDVVAACQRKAAFYVHNPMERVCAVMALCQLMLVSESFCAANLSLLFTIVSDKAESWVTKTNVVIALGDLACVHPNLLGPYLSVPTAGFFKLLVDDDLRVRAVTIQVCSHLVLGEMLRIRDHLYTIVKLVADPDETIAKNAVTFVQNLAMKEKEKTGNLIPPLVTQLSGIMPRDTFQLAMRTLLARVEGDKPVDSLIERLCQRFEAFSERSKRKRVLAQNIAFCLSELSYTSERAVKRLLAEPCYQQYKHWLRDETVLESFRAIAVKAKKGGRGAGSAAGERRDRSVIDEWEARMQIDSCTAVDEETRGDENGPQAAGADDEEVDA